MEKPEIIAGLKNALDRGYNLEIAKKSFMNAGYNIQDVEDSAKTFLGTLSSMPQNQFQQAQPQRQYQPKQANQPPQNQFPQSYQQHSQQQFQKQDATQFAIQTQSQPILKPSLSMFWLITSIVFGILFLALLGVLGGLIISPEQTKEFITGIFPFIPLGG